MVNMVVKVNHDFNKGSLTVESAIVVPICLLLACFGVLMLLLQYQKGVGSSAASGAALAAGANWGDSRRSLSDGSWNPGQEADGLYESLSHIGIGSLFKELNGDPSEKTVTAGYAELAVIAGDCRKIYADPDSSFIETKYARIIEFLIFKMQRSVLIPNIITFKIVNASEFPVDTIAISVTQHFNLPLIGTVKITGQAKSAAGGPSDFMEGTDLLIEIINRYLPLLKKTIQKTGE